MLLTLKRTLTIPFVAAVAVLPALSAHQAAHAATVTAATRSAAAASQTAAAGGTAGTGGVAAARRHPQPSRLRAYIWAAHQRGKPYCWGGTSGCFDCSGVVMAAYLHAGIQLARDTTEMLASSQLVQVSHRRAKKGDLAFYGTGHVELVAGRRYTFGALNSGTLVGWHRINRWWHPTMYFRIRNAG